MAVFSLLFYGSHIMSIPAESWRKSRTDMIDEGMFFFFIFISRLSGKYLRASGRHHFLSPKSTLIGSRLMRSMTDVLCMCVWPFFFLLWFYFVRADRTQWNGRIEFQCREEMRPTWAVYETISMSFHYVPEMMKATKTYIFMYREKGSSAPWHQAKQQIIIGQTTAHDKKKRKRIHQLQICIACVSHVSYEMLCVNTCRTRYSAERQSTGNGKRYLYLIASYIIHLIQLIPTRARCPQRLHGVKRWSFS